MKNRWFYFRNKMNHPLSGIMAVLVLSLMVVLPAGCSSTKSASADLSSANNAPEAVVPAEASQQVRTEVTIPEGTALSVRLLQSLGSASAQSGDSFDAELSKPVEVDGRVLFPKNTPIRGRVVLAKKSGRLHDPGKLEITLGAIQTSDGQWANLKTSSVYLQGQSHKKRNLALIGGGSGAGALIGGLAGGGKGLAIGALSGAAAGTAGAAATGEKNVTISAERVFRFTLKNPLVVHP